MTPSKGADDLVECLACARCCTYVGIGIDSPHRPKYATDVLWYLYHGGVYVYRDGDGDWSVHFESRCRNLANDNKCLVYDNRPHICRDFDNESCEVNCKEGEALTFTEPEAFLHWLRKERPKVYAAIETKFVPPALRKRRTFRRKKA
jgi:uncharacterized protein